MKWQMAGSDSVSCQTQCIVALSMVLPAEPLNFKWFRVILVVRLASWLTAMARSFQQFAQSDGTRDGLADSIARPVLRALHFSDVCFRVGVLVSSCAIRAVDTTKQPLPGVDLGKHRRECIPAASALTTHESLRHINKVADGRDSYPAAMNYSLHQRAGGSRELHADLHELHRGVLYSSWPLAVSVRVSIPAASANTSLAWVF